ncbi:MAG: hydrogenase [Nitrospiraceae bacterium]|nr:MAG: hydrogenase [Nitrospiraceae bacterium]
MNPSLIDPFLVLALLINFFVLGVSRLRLLIIAVAIQGAMLGVLYPPAHAGLFQLSPPALARLLVLTVSIICLKGWLIPKFLFKAMLLADMKSSVTSIIGFVPTLVLGGIATAGSLVFAGRLPLPDDQLSHLLIPAALATVLSGYLMLITRREALAQVLGYIVLENGIFIFGLLLIEAVPVLVELGIVLDLFVGVFVMGIIINHVSRAFPEASTEHLASLKE